MILSGSLWGVFRRLALLILIFGVELQLHLRV